MKKQGGLTKELNENGVRELAEYLAWDILTTVQRLRGLRLDPSKYEGEIIDWLRDAATTLEVIIHINAEKTR